MKITRIMATRPGICNVTNEEQINQVVVDMKQFGSNPEEIGQVVQTIKSSQPEVIKNILGQLKSGDPNKDLLQQFLRSRIATPVTKVFNSGNVMLDKYLARDETEGDEEAFDFKLNVLNMPGVPDLFDIMNFRTAGPAARTRSKPYDRSTMFSVVVEVLKGKGVKHIVFYDLTCSSFMSDDPIIEREERILRREILQKGLARKTTRRRKTKTKSRRGKKRPASTWIH
jgi:hypothetical protein